MLDCAEPTATSTPAATSAPPATSSLASRSCTTLRERRWKLELLLLGPCAVATTVLGVLGFYIAGGVTGLVAWTCAYDLTLRWLRRRSEWWRTPPPGETDDRATCVTLMLHEEGMCILLLALLVTLASATVGLSTWWRGSWALLDATSRPLAELSRHAHYATFAVELKDCFDGTLPLPFWVHHLATFAGLGMCLSVNAGVGLVTTVGLVAEIGSGWYNAVTLWPHSRLAFAAYLLIMNASNVFAALCLHEVLTGLPELHAGYRAAWASLCVLLLFLRTGGVLLTCRKRCCPAPAPEAAAIGAAAADEHAKHLDVEGVQVQIQVVEPVSSTADVVRSE